MKVKEEGFVASDFDEKGLKALGVRLAPKEALSAETGISKAAARAATAAEKVARASDLFPEGEPVSLKKKAAAAGKAAVKAKKAAAKGKAAKVLHAPGGSKGSAKGSARRGVNAGNEEPRGLKARAEAIKKMAVKKADAEKKPKK
jgi:hypothetical protein